MLDYYFVQGAFAAWYELSYWPTSELTTELQTEIILNNRDNFNIYNLIVFMLNC